MLAEGSHTLYFASRDYAGNIEVIKSSTIYVDGIAPGSPVNLKADGASPSPWKNVKEYNLSWTNPPDVSGIAGARVKFNGLPPASNEEGIFFLGQDSFVYPAPDIVNGQNAIWVWFQDNVGNAEPESAVQLTLRYDGIPPVSNAVSPSTGSSAVVQVSFNSSDEGTPDIGSGVNKTVLWHRNNGVAWSSSTYVLAGSSGTFSFNTQGAEGLWEFHPRAYDNAGNSEPVPVSTTIAKAQTFVDLTAPVISGIKATAFSPESALLEWNTDDETTAVIDYGRNASLGSRFTETVSSRTHSITLTGLPNPADIYFKITATNRTGLTAASAVNSFKTPLNISYDTDIFGVIDYTKPVTLYITNPDVSSATFVVNGQTWSGSVSTSQPVQIYVDPAVTGGGAQVINVSADGHEYSSSFVVDTATRSVKLVRLVVSAGGLMSEPQPGQSAVDATAGQMAQEEMQSAGSRLYLGYYAGIDPAAPAAISDFAAKAGPEAGQVSLEWTAPGDDDNVGTAMKYDLGYSSEPVTPENFSSAGLFVNVPLPQKAGTKQQTTVSGLSDGATYYFRLKTYDELLNFSISNSTAVKTLEVAQSTTLINNQPVVKVVSAIPGITVVQVSTTTFNPALVIATAAAQNQGLVFFSDIYEVAPPMTFGEGATIYFRYQDPGPEAEGDLAVYKFDFAQSKWIMLTGVIDRENNLIRAVTYSSSLYAVFGKDKTPPVTAAELSGGVKYTDLAGNIFVSSGTKAMLSATDPGASGGIARIEYRLDSSAGPFETYAAPLWLGEGWHSLQFRSVDKAGNTEQPKSLFLMKDVLEPRVEINFDREFVRLPGGIIHISSTSANLDILTLDQPSSGSGLKTVRFELDGAVSTVQSQHNARLDMGRHSIRIWAEDNVGNITETKAEVVVGDLLPPVILAPVNNFAAAGSTITFSWQHQTTTFFSLTEYALMLGAAPGFESPLFTHMVSSKATVSLSFDEAGVSIAGLQLHEGALRLVTERIPAHLEGTLEGTMTTSPIGLPALTTGISGFTASQTLNTGSISHEYSLDGVNYYAIPAHGNIALNMPYGGTIRFRSKLRRAALTAAGPVLAGIQFSLNYLIPQYYYYCHRHCFFCSRHCHSGYDYTAYSYSNSLSAANPQNTLAGLRAADSAVELITDYIADYSTGTLSGTWLSPLYEAPEEAYRIGDFIADYDSNGGEIIFEFSKSSASFRPVSELPSLNVKHGDSIRFRALFNRNSPNDVSPVFRGLSFNFIFPPPVETEFSLPEEGKYYWRVAAKDYMGRFSAASEERLIIYDTKPPVTDRLLEGATGQNGWYVSPVSVAFTSSDAVSGAAGTYYSVDGSSFTLYSSPFVLAVEGSRVLRYYSVDASGNKEAEKTFEAGIDLSSPTVLSSVSPVPNENGWNNAPVAILFTGSDTVSGIAYCSSSVTISGEGAGQAVTGYCADYAGFVTSATVAVNLDLTAPQVYISSPAGIGKYVATRNIIGVAFAFADNLDDKPLVSAKLVQTENKGFIRGATELVVFNADSIEPLDIDDGLWHLEVYARDQAGNSTTAVSGIFEVIHDVLAPRSGLSAKREAGGVKSPEGIEYVTERTTFTLTSADDLITSGDGAGLGVKRQRIEVRGEGIGLIRELAFENAEPRQGQTFVSTFTFAGVADGIYALAYNAEDIIGNIEEVKVSTYAVDNTAPVTEFRIAGIGYMKDRNLYIAGESGIYLESTDPVSNGVASGLKAVYLSVDNQAFALYSSTFTLAEGIHYLAFYGVDNVNNIENLKTATVRVDATPPVTSLAPGGNYYIPLSGQHVGDFYAPAWFAYKLSAYDPLVKDVSSGLAVSEYRITALDNFGTEPFAPSPQDLGKPFTLFNYNIPNNSFALAEGIERVDYRSRDNVLNLELMGTTTIFVDATPPVSSLVVSTEACCSRSDGLIVNSMSPLTVMAADPVIKGVASGPALSYFIENNVSIMTRDYIKDQTAYYHVPASYGDGPVNLTVFSIDNTGNNEVPFNARVVLDNTPPAVLIISPASSIENPGLCKLVGGTEVKVIGSVTDRGQGSEVRGQTVVEFDHFQSYTLEFGYGATPASYTLIASSSPGLSLESAVLGVWDTAGLPEGVYTLKLTAKDCVGNEAFTTAQVIISQPKLLLSLGSRGNGKGEFNSPSYIAVDPADGSFWVSDTNNNRLQKFTSSGTYILRVEGIGDRVEGKGKGQIKEDTLNKPTGVAVDSQGNLWVADRNNDRVLKFSSTGAYIIGLNAGFNKPHGLAVDANGNLWVADRNNDRVLKFSPEGHLLLTINTGIGADLNKPQGVIAVDYMDRVYITDRNNDHVLVYDSSGTFLRQLGEGSGSGPGQFNKPDGIALNALAYAYVADTNNSRVQKFDPYGNLVMVFDRASNDAEPFNHPGGLVLDADGNLFVVDSNNARVKKFGAEGELVLIASQEDGGQPQGADGASAAKLIAKAVGGKVHHPKGITVDIPAGALSSDAEITITAGYRVEGAGYRTQGAGRGKKLASITEAVEFGPDGAVFDKPVTISIPYNSSRLAAGVSESELTICRFNQSGRIWEELPSSVDTRLKVVSAQTAHFSLYTVMAPAVGGAEFALGEVYVFPNPAKGAQVPTFHIEAGIADKAVIKIYTVSGRLAHETTLTGLPQIIDDGHGSEYAYEYAWNGNIPSGVYYYFIEAEKAGQKLKKTGKFAVVR